ncbi:MAG: glycosyltransferase family 39 protein, partial [Candidatus Diapherotrites archaeon]
MVLVLIASIILELTGRYIAVALLATVLCILALAALNFRDFRRLFSGVKGRIWLFLSLALVLSFALRLYFLPLLGLGDKAIDAVEGAEIIINGEPFPSSMLAAPQAYSFLVAMVSVFFGQNIFSILFFNVLLSGLTAVLVFAAGYLLTKSEKASLFAAFIFAVFPNSIFFAPHCSEITASLFFMSLALAAFLGSIELKTRKSFLFFFLVFVFAVSMRPENALFLPVFLGSYLIFLKRSDWRKLTAPFIVFL